MRILVFGGTGFVGLNIAAALLARGHAVTVFDRAGLPPDARRDFASHGNRLTVIQGDVTDRDRKSTRLNSSHSRKSRMPSSA